MAHAFNFDDAAGKRQEQGRMRCRAGSTCGTLRVSASSTIQPHSSNGDGCRSSSADCDDADTPHAARVERFVDAVRLEGGKWQPQRLPNLLFSCERAPAGTDTYKSQAGIYEADCALASVSSYL